MKRTYHDLVAALWSKHEETPLSANEAALYMFLLDLGYKSVWRMPIRLHNSEVCPMLMEKSALEKARKKLQEKGLITFTASRSLRKLPTYNITGCETGRYLAGESVSERCAAGGCESVPANQKPRPCKTIVERLAAKNENTMVAALERMWSAFDERALNANEVTLFAYLLHEAERNQWQMPFRCKDYMLLTLLLKTSALDDARRELANRNLITFDIGDGRRDVPQYTITGVEKNAAINKGKSVAMCVGTSDVTPKATLVETQKGTVAETREDTSTEVNDAVPKESSHEVHRWQKAGESNVSPNPDTDTSGKPDDKPHGTEKKPQTKDKLNLKDYRKDRQSDPQQGSAHNHR